MNSLFTTSLNIPSLKHNLPLKYQYLVSTDNKIERPALLTADLLIYLQDSSLIAGSYLYIYANISPYN